MKKTRQNGFVLILVILAIAVIGAELFVLTGVSNTVLFQSNAAYLGAVERNLAASGLAWAERNIKDQNSENLGKTIELDVTDMNIRGSNLSVAIGSLKDKETEVRISTLCSRGRRTFRHNAQYRYIEHNQ